MQRSLPALLLVTLMLALAACGDEPAQPREAPAPQPAAEAVDSADPRSVFMAWQSALRLDRWDAAAGYSTSSLAAALRGAAGDTARAAAFPRASVEGVECFVEGDRAICLYGIEDGDRLRLDSAGLVRSDRGWLIERVYAQEKREGDE